MKTLGEFGAGDKIISFIWNEGDEDCCVQYRANTYKGIGKYLHKFNGAYRKIRSEKQEDEPKKYGYQWLASRCHAFKIYDVTDEERTRKTFKIK